VWRLYTKLAYFPTLPTVTRHKIASRCEPNSFRESEAIAELVGAILGDGNIYNKRPAYVELCGNPSTDLNYFKDVLLPIVRREIKREPKLLIRGGGLRFRINSKRFVEWLEKKGVPSGEAKANSTIPNFIVKNRRLLTCCIRGIFDTDGSVYFDMRPAYSRPYPRIDLHMTNHELLKQMDKLMDEYEIVHCFAKSKGSVITSGEDSLRQFLQKVGFSNLHHIIRIKSHYPELIWFNLSLAITREHLRRFDR
jgi:LAGLIDADG-like domain